MNDESQRGAAAGRPGYPLRFSCATGHRLRHSTFRVRYSTFVRESRKLGYPLTSRESPLVGPLGKHRAPGGVAVPCLPLAGANAPSHTASGVGLLYTCDVPEPHCFSGLPAGHERCNFTRSQGVLDHQMEVSPDLRRGGTALAPGVTGEGRSLPRDRLPNAFFPSFVTRRLCSDAGSVGAASHRVAGACPPGQWLPAHGSKGSFLSPVGIFSAGLIFLTIGLDSGLGTAVLSAHRSDGGKRL